MQFILALACFLSWIYGTHLLTEQPFVSFDDVIAGDDTERDADGETNLAALMQQADEFEYQQALGTFLLLLSVVIAFFAGRCS